MARPLRYILPGVAVHVVQRGVNRTACFRGDADHLVYLSYLTQLARRHECAIHAYCLMTNHVHLLLSPSASEACTGLMRDLGRRYVPYFNRKHGRTGTLWEGRFRSCLVESQQYVLACYRYIELNPVRAGMVNQPGSYLWSSYAANSGARHDPFISPHAEFDALSADVDKRQGAYRSFFADRLDEVLVQAIRDSTNSGYPLASDSFKTSVLAPLGWKTGPDKPGPRPSLDPDPEFELGVATLTPN
jgi:putative transposase